MGKRGISTSSPNHSHPDGTLSPAADSREPKPSSPCLCCMRLGNCKECFRNNDSGNGSCCTCFKWEWGKRISNGLIDAPVESRGRNQRRGSAAIHPDGRSSGSSRGDSYAYGTVDTIMAVSPQVVNDLVLQTLVLLRTLVGKCVFIFS